MRLIQLNVWWGGKLDRSILSFLKRMQPDIICLQESVDFDKSDAGLFLSTKNIQKELNLKYSAFAPAFSFNLMRGTARFGNTIISLAPIIKTETIYTNLDHIDNFDFNIHDYNVRNLLACSININSQALHVLTHHGHHIPDNKNGDAETLRQMKAIVGYIDNLSGPIIVAGDFNLAPRSKSLQVINQKLINLPLKYGLKSTRTSLASRDEVCDYIFINEEVDIKKFAASDELLSDHKALILDFEI